MYYLRTTVKFFFLLHSVLLPTQCFGQYEYILDVSVEPVTPTTTDSVNAILVSQTSNWSVDLGYTVHQKQDSFLIDHCVAFHPSTEPRTYRDTFNLGLLSVGTYIIKFTHYSSSSTDSCTYEYRLDSAITFEVTKNTSSPGLKKPEIQVYPNPASETIHISITQPMEVHIYDALGRKKEVAVFDKHHPIDVREWRKGIYLLYFPAWNQTRRIVIR